MTRASLCRSHCYRLQTMPGLATVYRALAWGLWHCGAQRRSRRAVALALCLTLCLGAGGAGQGLAGTLTPEAQRGEQIYLRGVSTTGQEIRAVVGQDGPVVLATVLPCVHCHGHDGRGKPEGGVTPSNITWEALTKPYGVTHPSGRIHPPYTERLLQRAITMGTDPAGTPLHTAMPRYRLSRQDLADVIAYLKQVGQDLDVGVTETTLRVGILLPPPGRLADMHRAVRAALSAYFDALNQQGGLYNRRLEARFADASEAPADLAPTIRTFIETEQVFALTSSFIAEAEAEVAALVTAAAVPLVGAFALVPHLDVPANRYMFYLDAGLHGQGRTLAAFAAERYAMSTARATVLYPDVPSARQAAEAIVTQCRHEGWETVEALEVPDGQFNAALLAQRLSTSGTAVVFFLGPSAAAAALLQEASQRLWQPLFLMPGALAGTELLAVPMSFQTRVLITAPTLPAAPTPDGLIAYRRLAAAYQLPSHHLTAQLTALASAMVLVEGLKRVGREVRREKLIEALEGLYAFPTGLIPPLTYGPNRRVGILGASVVAVDLAAQRLVPANAWIEPR